MDDSQKNLLTIGIVLLIKGVLGALLVFFFPILGALILLLLPSDEESKK